MRLRLAATCLPLLVLAACDSGAPPPEAEETEIPDELAAEPMPQVEVDESIGTPLEERVATIGLINKRNNISRDIELRPGEQQRVGDVIIRLASCERTAPWETPPLTGGFVQVLVQERADVNSDPEWNRIFSGWLYKEAPAVNVVEHPIYDVWMKDCAMSFPGEEEAASASSSN
ncbi:DUF2155 domain-containing protein [Alteraurantiacibacter aquimixticola]|uniref:DUF2155 domain-containing protein n=1 Tax=Alteraurantiacibacter aquimixticola TaxID=2489173 RepID=A0A4T3F537_9SPHN|nr:DUF2155 domain-containing protein [Alteraurantiacibacter aquimixticola]TIX49853.1 DUF2155 domain-containing protein [Alteraurantiacibacter aquimixticola]